MKSNDFSLNKVDLRKMMKNQISMFSPCIENTNLINRNIINESIDGVISLFMQQNKINCCKIGLYLPMRGEVVLSLYINFAIQCNYTILIPQVTANKEIFFTKPTDETMNLLKRGDAFSPKTITNGVKNTDMLFFSNDHTYEDINCVDMLPNLIFVPALAFDKNGIRLGRGWGCYDKYIKKSRLMYDKKVMFIGVCYENFFLNHKIPKDEHDEKINFIITERGLSSFT